MRAVAFRRATAYLAAVVLLVTVTSGCSSSTSETNVPSPTSASAKPTPNTILVTNTNPYYSLLVATRQPAVAYAATVHGCVIKPQTTCRKAQLTGAMLREALFDFADLTGADLSGATLELASFTHARLAGADLSRTDLTGVALNSVAAPGISLRGSALHLGSIANSNLIGADLRGLDANFGAVVGSDLSRAALQGANLSDTDFNGDNLSGANLTGANLANADLTGSDLTGANLTGASFCNTLMPNGSVRNPRMGLCPGQASPAQSKGQPIVLRASSPFFGAVYSLLYGKQLAAGGIVNGCKIQAYTTCPNASLREADLQGAFLGYAKLDGADVSGVNFYLGSIAFGHASRANFTGSELGATAVVDATMENTSFVNAKLNLTNLVGHTCAAPGSRTQTQGRRPSTTQIFAVAPSQVLISAKQPSRRRISRAQT